MVERRMRLLTEQLAAALPSGVIAELQHLIGHREYGLAFEGLCEFLRNEQILVDQKVHTELRSLNTLMQFDEGTLKGIALKPPG